MYILTDNNIPRKKIRFLKILSFQSNTNNLRVCHPCEYCLDVSSVWWHKSTI